MTDIQKTIADLSAALTDAWNATQEATTHQRRKARNQRTISCGVALYERLCALNTWLQAHDTAGEDSTYLSNLRKYEEGWKTLDGVAGAIAEWKRTHWEETHDRFGPGRRENGLSGAEYEAREAQRKQARVAEVALAKAIVAGHRGAVARSPESGELQSAMPGVG